MAPRLKLLTAATSEPVAKADFMAFARIDTDPADGVMDSLIKAARRRVEKETGLSLLPETWLAVLDRWPTQPAPDWRYSTVDPQSRGLAMGGGWWDGVRDGTIAMLNPSGIIEIPKRPFGSVTSFKVREIDLSLTTIDPALYYVDTSQEIGRIGRVPGSTWAIPKVAFDAIEITFTCGYASASAVPEDLLLAIKMLAAHWHENREPVVQTGRAMSSALPLHVEAILSGYHNLRIGR